MASPLRPSTLFPSLADGFESFADRRFWSVAVILFFFTLEFNGVGLVPVEHYQRFAQHPFVIRTDIRPTHEWQDSFLLPLTAFWMGATSRFAFNGLCVAILILGYGTFLTWSLRRNGKTVALLLFLLLLGNPLTAILWGWIGMPDCISFLCVVLALFVRSRPALFVVASAAMANHPAGAIAVGCVVVLRLASQEEHFTLSYCGAVLAGWCAGAASVRAFNAYNDILVTSRLQYALALSPQMLLQLHADNLPATLFSFQQTTGFVMAFLALIFARKDPRYFIVLGAIMIVALSITFFILDTTRVFVLLTCGATFHSLSHCIALNKREFRELDSRTVLGVMEAFALAGLLVPRFYIWYGTIFTTPFKNTVELIRHIG